MWSLILLIINTILALVSGVLYLAHRGFVLKTCSNPLAFKLNKFNQL